MHGETPLWPIWSVPLARLYHQLAVAWRRLSSADDRGGAYFVIPEDVSRKSLMSDASRWCEMSPWTVSTIPALIVSVPVVNVIAMVPAIPDVPTV
jgi:hypothetical protein